jgi:UDP-N-acetylglucosamine 2-epimerase (non-hydrolysing)
MSSQEKVRTRSLVRILAVAGARPNFMKIAALLRELRLRPGFEVLLAHTGQHYDEGMSQRFFTELGIPEPDVDLGVGSGSHAWQTGEILKRIEPVLQQMRPDGIVVVGDVNSTLAGALAAVKLGIPVAHVEAGLRSFDPSMPEETNRKLTDAISRWLFTTEPSAQRNLLREGIPVERIHFVGNVMIDTLRTHLEAVRSLDTLERLGLEPQRYAVLTLHRPSNVDDPVRLRRLFAALEEIHGEIPILFPVHPRTRSSIERRLGGSAPRLCLTEPLGYPDFLRAMADAKLVLTDSGGIQEETTALGVPCLTLRDNTERPVTVSEGTNTLVGSDPATLRTEVRKILQGGGKRGRVPERWDGRAAARIADVLGSDLGEPA